MLPSSLYLGHFLLVYRERKVLDLPKCILTEQQSKTSELTLERIYVDTVPTKVSYSAGETFSADGMVVKADFSLQGATVITGASITGYICSPTRPLTAADTTITISYSYERVTKTTTQAITVTRISVTPPTVTGAYTYNGSQQEATFSGWSDTSMVKKSGYYGTNAGSYTAVIGLSDTSMYQWNDSSLIDKEVAWSIGKATPTLTAPTAKTGLIYTGSSQTLANAGSTTGGTLQYSSDNSTWDTAIPGGINAGSYTVYYRVVGGSNYNDIAAASFQVSIGKATPTVTPPTAKNLTYTGSAQVLANAGSTTGGTMQYSSDNSNWSTTIPSGTNANTSGYTVYYRVAGGTNYNDIAAASITVPIAKANATLSVSPTTAKIGLQNYQTGVAATITYVGDGTLSAVSSDTSVAVVAGSGTTSLTITGDGVTEGSATITISATAGSNYNAPSNATIAVTVSYVAEFDWGAEDGTADATWFADLKTYLASNPGKSEWVGKTKSVTLSSAVQGTTTHLVRCIGVNLDADNTVTFQTANSLATTSKFSSLSNDSANYANGTNYHHENNLIYDGNTGSVCKSYYNAFPGKNSIKQVSKGTCVTQVSTQDGTAVYQNQYVWIPSEGEVGLDSYASLKYSNWTTSNGECTQGKKFQYPYYTDNTSRVKKKGDAGSAYSWWPRGHAYSSAYTVCRVSSNGSAGYGSYYDARGVAPAFVIGN